MGKHIRRIKIVAISLNQTDSVSLLDSEATYIGEFRVCFPIGEESVGAQVVFKAPASDTLKKTNTS